jgi:hypothetical protein
MLIHVIINVKNAYELKMELVIYSCQIRLCIITDKNSTKYPPLNPERVPEKSRMSPISIACIPIREEANACY